MNRARKRGAEAERQLLLVEEPLGAVALALTLIEDAMQNPSLAPVFLKRAQDELRRAKRGLRAFAVDYPYWR